MKPYFKDERVKLYQADVLAWALWYLEEIKAGRAKPPMEKPGGATASGRLLCLS